MASAKQRDAAMQIAAVVAPDRPGNARLRGGGLQLAVHQLSVRLGYRLEVDQVHVLLAEDPLLRVPGRLADADDDQTLAVAQLKCVVHDPHPVV
jgi:hypothetical protein